MPAVAIVTPAATFAFRYDFGTWSLKQPVALSEWVLSVDREAPYRGPTFGLFDEARDLRPEGLDGLSPHLPFRSGPPGPGQVLVRRQGSMGRGHAPPDPRVACVTDEVTALATTAPVAWSSLGRGDGEHTDLFCQLAIDDHERVPLHHVSPNTSPFGIRGPRLGNRAISLNAARTARVNPIPYFAPSARSSSTPARRTPWPR